MPTILCYTRHGEGTYPDHNYPGHVAYLCDLEHALHLAFSEDGQHFIPMRNNTGVLFPACTFDEGDPKGTTKTLVDPFIGRNRDGGFIVSAIRHNRNAVDPLVQGAIMLYESADLVHYKFRGFLRVSDHEISKPQCTYDADTGMYFISWIEGKTCCYGVSPNLHTVRPIEHGIRQKPNNRDYDIAGCVPGNEITISKREAVVMLNYLYEIYHTGTAPIQMDIIEGTQLHLDMLPKATCMYSDGSTHEKAVDWNQDDLDCLDTSCPGVYTVHGHIHAPLTAFPLKLGYGQFDPYEITDPNVVNGMSDPCVTYYHGKYYLTSTGNHNIVLRCADRLTDVFQAAPICIYSVPREQGVRFNGTWAPELHEIDDALYLFTAICPGGDWTRVTSCVLKCHGDPCTPSAWEAPQFCVKPDGTRLTTPGISLDMTWFRDRKRDYVVWSNRKIYELDGEQIIEPADLYIASVDPARPWQLTSEPKCLIRPTLGWERCETEVVEAPYIIKHGEDILMSYSCSSTGMSDLYDVGLLKAKTGSNLLDDASWERIGFPLLTQESVINEHGPGHNNFVVDHESGDLYMVYHAVPHDENDMSMNRQPGIRRVHWATTGLPYLEMTPERDLVSCYADVTLTVHVKSRQ